MDRQQKMIDGWLKLGFTKREAELADALLDATATVLRRVKSDFEAKLATLEERCERIEQKGVEYRGVWQQSQDYAVGDLVTSKGAIWHSTVKSRAVRPGEGAIWQLCVKAGRDSR